MDVTLHNNSRQQGAVSLFVVIFTALLITTITISFMQLMMKDQQQSIYSDLSESAYDSAMAGVEDAKRALLMQEDCKGKSSDSCTNISTALNSGQCTTLSTIFGGEPSGEVAIVQDIEIDRKLDQAYTCVKVTQDTKDYLGSIEPNASGRLIPLRGKSQFNKVIINWALSRNGEDITLPPASMYDDGIKRLPVNEAASWPDSYPALLRAQLINGRGTFRLGDFDSSGFSNALFLYPAEVGDSVAEFALDGRRSGPKGEPLLSKCFASPDSGTYACSVEIEIAQPIPAGSNTTFLNLAAFYNVTDYQIVLKNNDDTVDFDSVQPEVDSTGRANDLFRRVVSRVEIGNAFNYPVAALETRNSICKNFSITTDPNDYSSSSQCSPTN